MLPWEGVLHVFQLILVVRSFPFFLCWELGIWCPDVVLTVLLLPRGCWLAGDIVASYSRTNSVAFSNSSIEYQSFCSFSSFPMSLKLIRDFNVVLLSIPCDSSAYYAPCLIGFPIAVVPFSFHHFGVSWFGTVEQSSWFGAGLN